ADADLPVFDFDLPAARALEREALPLRRVERARVEAVPPLVVGGLLCGLPRARRGLRLPSARDRRRGGGGQRDGERGEDGRERFHVGALAGLKVKLVLRLTGEALSSEAHVGEAAEQFAPVGLA